jgi:hypothetical protein
MADRHDRRRFLGMGIGVATAPLLAQVPFAAAGARQVLQRKESSDFVLDHLRLETLRTYRQVRSDTEVALGVRGEECRALAAQLTLLDAYFLDKGHHARLDAELRERVLRDGRATTADTLGEACRAWRDSARVGATVALPPPPDTARIEAALELFERRGARASLRLAAGWAKGQGIRADGDAVHPVRRPAGHQKPGDDFGGYPEVPPVNIDCESVGGLIDTYWLMIALFTLAGAALIAEVLAVLVATAQLISRFACAPRV